MNPKIISTIKAILMALITVLGFFGLGKYVPLIELIQEQLSPVAELIAELIAIGALFFAWRPATDEQTKGKMLKAVFKTKVKTLSSRGFRTDYFNYK